MYCTWCLSHVHFTSEQQTPATTWLSITHDHSPLAFTIEPLWLLGSTSVSISEKRSWRFAPWWLWFPAGTHSSTDLLGCRSTFDCEKSRFLADAESIYIYAWNVCVYILYYIILYYVILYYIVLYYIISYHIMSYYIISYYNIYIYTHVKYYIISYQLYLTKNSCWILLVYF